MLEVRNLSVTFTPPGRPSAKAVDDVSFDVCAGEIVGLVGESGSGKSVSCQAALGLLPRLCQVDGSIELDGDQLLELNERRWARLRGTSISAVLQDPFASLNPVMSIGSQMIETIRSNASVTRRVARAKACKLLAEVGLPDPAALLRKFPHQLSGGMNQRVAIAIAISGEPKYLLADEPTTALDVTVQAQVVELLKGLVEKRSMGVLFVSHDLGVLAGLCDRIIVMYQGKVVESASVDALYAHQNHWYTKSLLDSLPVRRSRATVEQEYDVLEDRGTWADACAFAGRCPAVQDDCLNLTPALRGEDTKVRCLHPVPAASSVSVKPAPSELEHLNANAT